MSSVHEELDHLVGAFDADTEEEMFAELASLEPHMSTLRRMWGEAKVPELAELVRSELNGGQEKLVVFYVHTAVGNRLAELLSGFHPLVLNGSTVNKPQVVDAFRLGGKHRVLLAQLVAGGTGLDGMQHATNRVILGEYAWTPAVNQQAIARVGRAGQTRPVRASYITMAKSMDDHIARALVRKEQIVKEVFGA